MHSYLHFILALSVYRPTGRNDQSKANNDSISEHTQFHVVIKGKSVIYIDTIIP